MNVNLKNVTIAILSLIILAGAIFFGIQSYSKTIAEKNTQIYNSGVLYGANYTLQQIVSIASQCRTFPVTFDNVTTTIVSLECVKQELQKQKTGGKLK